MGLGETAPGADCGLCVGEGRTGRRGVALGGEHEVEDLEGRLHLLRRQLARALEGGGREDGGAEDGGRVLIPVAHGGEGVRILSLDLWGNGSELKAQPRAPGTHSS